MSGKRKQTSALMEAAQAFDEALEAHTRAGELFVRSPLATTKHLERANELLGEIAAAEQRLGECGAALSVAVTATRDRQAELTKEIVARLPQIKERNEQLQRLMQAFHTLGAETASLNATVSGTDPRAVVASLTALSDGAAALASEARAAGFEELANQGHALHQRIAAAAKKLQSATGG